MGFHTILEKHDPLMGQPTLLSEADFVSQFRIKNMRHVKNRRTYE